MSLSLDMKEQEIIKEFAQQAIYRMDESMRMIKICLDQLNNEEVWIKPNKELNSIGNLLLHLEGNIRQYSISALGDHPDQRIRDKEFLAKNAFSKSQLLQQLLKTVEEAKSEINQSTYENWIKTKHVQGFHFTGIGIVTHVVEHLSYHTGQIAWQTKWLKNKDLGFYKDLNLNITN